MNTWKVILATLVIFVAGVVTGTVLVLFSGRTLITGPRNGSQRQFQPTPGGMRLEFLHRVQRDLDLTPDQRERIDKILKESQDRTRKMMAPVLPALRLEFQRTKEEFRDVLTPEQRQRFDKMFRHPQRPHEQRKSGPPHESLPGSESATNAPVKA